MSAAFRYSLKGSHLKSSYAGTNFALGLQNVLVKVH